MLGELEAASLSHDETHQQLVEAEEAINHLREDMKREE